MWIVENGKLTNDQFIELPAAAMSKPYPASLWRVEEGKLTNGLLPEIEELGAFCHCTNLTRVSIPESVKKIGRYAFRHTALKKVKIAPDCKYYLTSFPDGCEISYYGGGGPYVPLYDSAGYQILDSSGAAIYVRSD